MGVVGGLLAGALIVGGTAMSVTGSLQEGAAAKASARYNARAATQEAAENADRTRQLARRRRSLNIVRVAKSGVRLSGSPLLVMAENAYETEKQAQAYIRAGQAASMLYRLQGRAGVKASAFSAASSGLTGLGSLIGAGTQSGAFGPGGAAPGSGSGVR